MTTPAQLPDNVADCGCPDFRTSRRRFLQGLSASAGAAMVTGLVGDVFTQASFARTVGGNVMVVLSLRGGSDGLSMVVPHGDPAYADLRPRIAIPTSQLLVKDEMFGLHPEFAPLQQMWTDGRMAAVQAVGMPQPNRSHFSAMEAVEDADPGSGARVGWINRMVGLSGGGLPNGAVQLGTSIPPTALVGPAPAIAVYQLSDVSLPGDVEQRRRIRRALRSMWDGNGSLMGQAVSDTLETTTRLSALAQGNDPPQNGATYPTGDLGAALRQTARLIRAEVGTEVVALDYGSWDMHTDLGTLDWGEMQSMVRELSRALAAFFVDLGTLGDRVTVVTISEFGRTASENGAVGTEHGYGNAMLLLGGGVRGGSVYGVWPGLDNNDMVDGDLAVTRDYRSVLAEVLASRFPGVSVPGTFPGFTPESIGAML
jgi:uncharacterized protein (DUF1501 family)